MATSVTAITKSNDGINVPDDAWGVTTAVKFDTTIRFMFPTSERQWTALYGQDQWRGSVFFQTADTVAPYVGRKTTFPKAD